MLVLVGYYPPAYLAGGPTRVVPRIAELLGGDIEFWVVTRDHDIGVRAPLAGVERDRWRDCRPARCLYLSLRRRLSAALFTVLRRTPHDALYLNSVFSIEFSLIPLLLRRLRLVPRRGLIVAPRGELDDAALAIKRRRKRLYLWLVHRLGLADDAVWHAAHQAEATAIRGEFGDGVRLHVVPDIPGQPGSATRPPRKEPGRLAVVFLSRIARMKNLDYAIRSLIGVRGAVDVDVYGPIEDRAYWAECQAIAASLPDNVRLRYRGIVEPNEVSGVLARHHLFFLPTRGESFGHAIAEALMAGCPVLISDQTPWRDLEVRMAGWTRPLGQPELFREVLERCVDMSQLELEAWSAGALRLGHEIAVDPTRDAAYRALFKSALGVPR